MKITFFGSSLVSSYWNGAASYYRGLLKALARRGHCITFYEPDAFDRQAHRDMADPDWARVVVYPSTSGSWRAPLADAARDADLLVKASGIGVFDAELEAAVPTVRRPGALCAFWDVDAPVTLAGLSSGAHDPLRASLASYDIVFTYGGGAPVVRRYLDLGARACVPVYNAVDPETHFPVPRQPRFDCDLSLLANRLPDREARIDAFFLATARRLPDRRFLLGGAGWTRDGLPTNVTALGHVGSGDHNAFFCSGRATLNVNRESMARTGYSPPTRVFEAAGAGACLITDAWAGIESFLEPGTEVLVAEGGEEVADLLAGLDRRRAALVGDAARRRVLAQHTYTQRARQVDQLLGAWTAQGRVA